MCACRCAVLFCTAVGHGFNAHAAFMQFLHSCVQMYYVATSRETKRLESLSRSPVRRVLCGCNTGW